MVVIDQAKCDGCGLCVEVCRCDILILVDSKVAFTPKERCGGCARWCAECEAVCPSGAISYPFEVVTE